MPQWKPEDEALFAELCRRAEQQSREAALRAAPAPPLWCLPLRTEQPCSIRAP